ncbi:DNA polymerase IV [Brunnivagina elsteri]|uniref:DNA polymerase IV n=1 Tax=Brunnivagina elsteri CCALA 953 TaxID=987040 RepID=A0A2A2TBT8_9CYAN|nr:DNA polymerase IV [Calothrix elsteri]PAX51115.1 DNA polymerase IV [Calothrix elsteri CCALA 953]
MSQTRKIIHIDMDAFYASVEQRDNPSYRGKPLAVGSSPSQRGVVAAASYEARKYGIHSAMASSMAVAKCPNLIIVRPRFEVYRGISDQIHDIFRRYTDIFEPVALDEAYLDVTENKQGFPYASTVARHIRAEIFAQTNLTASAGVSINKFLAKMASSINKPNGMTVILPEDAIAYSRCASLVAFVEGLPIEKFHGIGKVTAAKMQSLGIRTGADLKMRSLAFLVQQFGKAGQYYYNIARAIDDRAVEPNRIRKSIAAENAHQGQKVPGTKISYIMHLSFVSMEIIAALNIEPERDGNLAIQCAILHDTIEDTNTTFEQLESEFGAKIANPGFLTKFEEIGVKNCQNVCCETITAV